MKIYEIKLTDEEKVIYNNVCWNLNDLLKKASEDRVFCLDQQGKLFESLLTRKAIPSHRLAWLYDPKINSGGYGKSKWHRFIDNCKEKEAVRHPHFTDILKYLIHGPNLLQDSIDGFNKILTDEQGTSGMVISQFNAYIRQKNRDNKQQSVNEEFVKLLLEITKNDPTHDLNRYVSPESIRKCR